jgi:hypothetical protein
MDSASKKRRRSVRSHQTPGKKARAAIVQLEPAPSAEKVSFNNLCSVCEAIFARISRDRKYTFSWFHNVYELIDSVLKGCHFCNLLMANLNSKGNLTKDMVHELLKMKEEDPDMVPNLLKAETRYVWKAGVSFLVRFSDGSEWDVLAHIDLSFEDALGKPTETSYSRRLT